MHGKTLYRITAGLALINVIVWSLVCFEEIYKNRIYPGTSYAGISLGGQTVDAAVQKVATEQKKALHEELTITAGDTHATTTFEKLGASVDEIALANILKERTKPSYFVKNIFGMAEAASEPTILTFQQPLLTAFLEDLKKQIDRAPHDASLTYKDNQIHETSAVEGKTLDVAVAKTEISQKVRLTNIKNIELSVATTYATLKSPDQLASAKQKLTQLLSKPFSLTSEKTTITIQPSDLFNLLSFGVVDNALAYDIDQTKAGTHIDTLAKKVAVAPIAKQLSATGATVVEGIDGKQLDKLDAYKKLSEAVINGESSATVTTTVLAKSTRQDSGDFYDLNRSDGKFIDVSLSKQRIAIIENNVLVRTFAVSTGKWSTPTPTGEFIIHNHITTAWSARYGLYMDDWMAITSDGDYGFHRLPRWPNGTLEGTNHIGTPVSHGCIRLAPGDSTELYNWAKNGTKVFIHN